MRNIRGLMISILIGMCLVGCTGIPDTQTIVLPKKDTENEQSDQNDDIFQEFQVNKIYTVDFDGKVQEPNMVFFQENEEHGIGYYENGLKGSKKIFTDYRYGFFEEKENPLNDSQKINILYGSDPSTNPISPDGNYVIYQNSENGYQVGPIQMINMETGEETTLLVGDEEGYSGEYVYMLNAFSRDGKTACYGYYPRNRKAVERYSDRLKLYCIDLESGEELGVIDYCNPELIPQIGNFENARLCIERFENKILVALINESSYYNREEAAIYRLEISELEQELWGENVGEYFLGFLIRRGSPLYLDAEHTWVYPCIQTKWKAEPNLEIAPYQFTDVTKEENTSEVDSGDYGSCIVNTENEVLKLLVLNEGKVIITAEQIPDSTDVDIYIYQWNGEDTIKRILYKNAGYVYSLQYDPQYHRILAMTDDEYNVMYQALILEFAN